MFRVFFTRHANTRVFGSKGHRASRKEMYFNLFETRIVYAEMATWMNFLFEICFWPNSSDNAASEYSCGIKTQSQKRRINDLYYKLHKKLFQNSCFGSKVIKIKKTSKNPDNWDISSPCKTLFLLLRCTELNKAIKPTFNFQHLVNVIFVFSSSRYPVQNCSSLVPEKIQWSNAVSDCTFVDLLIQLYYFIGPLRLFNLSTLLQGNFHSWYKTVIPSQTSCLHLLTYPSP